MELDMDFLKSLISDFDLMALLPDMAEVMEWIVTAVNYALIVGPVLLVLLGLWYLVLPTKEANHFVGYRFFWGMGSIKSWRFTQRFAGAVWAILGTVLAVKAYDGQEELAQMETLDMLYRAGENILTQIYWVVVVCVAINVFIFILFDFKGNIRKIWRMLVSAIKKLIDNIKAKKPEKQRKRERPAPNENQQ